MHFLTPLLTTLALASTSTQALKLPEGYSIIEVIPIDPEDMYKEAKGNPHVPLINATIRCGRNYQVLMEVYELEGYGWDGVSEKQLRKAADEGGVMTGWKFKSWGASDCDPDVDAENGTCVRKEAGWKARVSLFFLFSECFNLATISSWLPRLHLAKRPESETVGNVY